MEKPSESRPVFPMAYSQAQQDENNTFHTQNLNDLWPLAGRSSLSGNEVDLLKYYSHHIVPWVSLHSR